MAQLAEKGVAVTVEDVLQEMEVRDKRDSQRATAPLTKAPDAVEIDSTQIAMDEVVAQIIALVERRKISAEGATDG